MSSTVIKENFPASKTEVLSNLVVGDMFVSKFNDLEVPNIYLICLVGGNRIYINIISGTLCPFYDDIDVYPIDVEINYSKHY